MQVCIADIDVEEGQATVATLQAKHGEDKVMFFSCNITNDDQFKGELFFSMI